MIYLITPRKPEYYTTQEDLHQLIQRMVSNDTPVMAERGTELRIPTTQILGGIQVMVSADLPEDEILLISRSETGQLSGRKFKIINQGSGDE